jgi:hypothetical protein
MAWLRDGVPITLLADLAARGGPLSREILAAEALHDDIAATVPQPRSTPARTSAAGDRQGFSRASGS